MPPALSTESQSGLPEAASKERPGAATAFGSPLLTSLEAAAAARGLGVADARAEGDDRQGSASVSSQPLSALFLQEHADTNGTRHTGNRSEDKLSLPSQSMRLG